MVKSLEVAVILRAVQDIAVDPSVKGGYILHSLKRHLVYREGDAVQPLLAYSEELTVPAAGNIDIDLTALVQSGLSGTVDMTGEHVLAIGYRAFDTNDAEITVDGGVANGYIDAPGGLLHAGAYLVAALKDASSLVAAGAKVIRFSTTGGSPQKVSVVIVSGA